MPLIEFGDDNTVYKYVRDMYLNEGKEKAIEIIKEQFASMLYPETPLKGEELAEKFLAQIIEDVEGRNFNYVEAATLITAGDTLKYNLYIQIAEKYIVYVKKGDELEKEKLDRISAHERETNRKRLFIHSEELENFKSHCEEELEQIDELDGVEDEEEIEEVEEEKEEEKLNRVLEIAKNSMEICYNNPDSQAAFELTEKAAKGLRKRINRNPKSLGKIFKKRGQSTDKIQDHCRNVSALAGRLAFARGFRGKDLDNICSAALVHDLGLLRLPRDVANIYFERPPDKLFGDAKRLYEIHVDDGVGMLKDKDYVNKDIIELVMYHEQNKAGTGYPKKYQKMGELHEILSLCNKFDKLVSVYGYEPYEAFSELQQTQIGNYDLKLIKKLKEILETGEVFRPKD